MNTKFNTSGNQSEAESGAAPDLARYSAVVTGGGVVLEKSEDDFTVERMKDENDAPLNKYKLSWVNPILNNRYDVSAAPNFKYAYAVPHASRTETSCELVFFNSAQTELITNFSCSVAEF